MKFGLVTRSSTAYSTVQLSKALRQHGIEYVCFSLPELTAQVARKPYVRVREVNVDDELRALIVRPIGRGSLEEIVFRLDVLHRLRRVGVYVINPPEAIEHCSDKYDVLTILEDNGIPVPRTLVTGSVNAALDAFHDLGGDVIIKPIFGSRGVGTSRVTDPEVAVTIFKALNLHHSIIYLQQYIQHGSSDIRAFVVGGRVIAAMRRVANGWKTNYSQGAKPVHLKLGADLEELAVRSARVVDCKIAGVDILESPTGPLVVEVNSRPGWRGLQSVSKVSIAEEIIRFILAELGK